MSPVLHPASNVLSRRHGPSWMLLALAAGAVNAGAFLACENFVSHLTGAVTQLGVNAGAWELTLDYGLVLAAFVVGAMSSVLAIQARVHHGKRPLHAVPLFVVSTILLGTAWAGQLGVFGEMFAVDDARELPLVCLLAFAMGLMNASVATSTELAVRTTHVTGPATDFGVYLGVALFTTGHERAHALRIAALRGGKVVAFSVGALLMVPCVRTLDYLAFCIPAALVLVATLLSFMPPRRATDHDSTALNAAR